MKKLQKYLYEYLALLFVSFLPIVIFYLSYSSHKKQTLRSILAVLLICDCIGIYLSLRKLWRTKWKRRFVISVQKILAKLAKRILPLLEKWSKGKKETVLSGKTTISFDLFLSEQDKTKPQRAPRWKNLQSNRERLGYLYKNMIEAKIKRGLLAYPSDTPKEIESKNTNDELDSKIFELYIENRYKDSVKTDTETLNELRKELNKRT